jgi:hypothetical protein
MSKPFRRRYGRCRICGRVLTDPVSIARGIGPECYSKRSQVSLFSAAPEKIESRLTK